MIDRLSLQEFKVAEGEDISAEAFNDLLDALDRALRFTGDAKVRLSRVGRATFLSARSRGGVSTPVKWKLTADATDDGMALSWDKGLVAGIEPTIGGVKISEPGADGLSPTLKISRSMLVGGQAHAFIKLTLDHDSFVPTAAEMLAAPKPEPQPFEAWKLAATVHLSDDTDPTSDLAAEPWLFYNIGFYPSLRTAAGRCRNWFWAQ